MNCFECGKPIIYREQHAVNHTTTGIMWAVCYYHLACFIEKVKKGEVKDD